MLQYIEKMKTKKHYILYIFLKIENTRHKIYNKCVLLSKKGEKMKRAKGTGTVIKVKRNLHKPYLARITEQTYKDENGKNHEIKKSLGYFKTQKEAQQALEDYIKNKEQGITTLSKLKFIEVWQKWENEKQLDNLSDSTYKGYKYTLDKIPEDIKQKQFNLITFDELQEIINKQKENNRNYDSLRKIKNVLSQVYEFAIIRDIVNKNLAKKLNIGHSRRKGQALILDDKEIKQVKELIEKEQNINTRLTAQIIYMLILNGCRISEFLDLKIKNINLKERYIKIENAKTEAGDRLIPIHQGVINIYQELYDPENEYFLINPNTNKKFSYANFRDSYFDQFRSLLNWNEEITPHNMRKTFSSLLKRFNADPTYQKLILGHEGALDLTEKTYTAVSFDKLEETVNLIDLNIVLK